MIGAPASAGWDQTASDHVLQMGSHHPLKQWFDPVDLDTLEWIFDAVWSEIQIHHPVRNHARDEELKGVLRRKLFALACFGGINQERMLRALMAGFIPDDGPMHSAGS